jgi:drug/metabolite transporter (DMT)-like permease
LGTLYFLPLFLLTEAGSFSWKEYVPADFLPVIYMAIFASSLAFILFVEGVKKIGITRATVFTNFVPIITAIFSIFFAGEEMTFLKAGGIFVMVSGLFMSQATGVKKIRIYSRVKE